MKFTLSKAALVALAFEIAIIAALAVYLAKKPEKPEQKVVMLSFPAPPEPPKPEQPKQKQVSKPKPVRHEVRQQVVQKPVVQQPKIEDPAPSPAPAPVAAPPQAPARPAQPSPPGISATFRDEVNAAVQAALQYPFAAKMAHITGKTQVAFDYLDRQASHAAVVASSGYAMLDRAALQAVMAANYPPPPQNLAGKSVRITIWVRFYRMDGE